MEYACLKENAFNVRREPLAGASLTNLLFLIAQNRFQIDTRYIPRILYALTVSSVLTPLRIKEFVQFDKSIINTEVPHHPIFILGHWRSGTTYLHNLLTLDPAFGFFTTLHAALPNIFLGNEALVNPFVKASLPEKRPMDDVRMGPPLPQEDEFALAAVTPYSGNHGLCFPRNVERYYRFIFMEDVAQEIKEEWKKTYRYLIQKETLYRNGRQLVLKNPANTARVQLLLEIFPDAKFIHIYRNPYHIYRSMMKLLLNIVPFMCVQNPPTISEVERQVFRVYKQMYVKYFKERTAISNDHLIEIRYEEFIKNPLEQMHDVYKKLGLPGFEESEKTYAEYIASQTQLKTDQYILAEREKEKIYEEWGFAFDTFQYEK